MIGFALVYALIYTNSMKRDFSQWLATMRSSINSYSYYVDFQKVYENVDNVRVELNILNSLIGVKDIRAEFLKLLKDYPKTLKCVPILLACRQMEIYAQDDEGAMLYNFANPEPAPRSNMRTSWSKQDCSTSSATTLSVI